MTLTPRQQRRLVASIDASGDCWRWTGSAFVDLSGQLRGTFFASGSRHVAARAVWQHLVGPIPPGLELDHLCRNPICVNPDHMEPVTHAENQRRGFSPSGLAARKVNCKRGHPLSGSNLYVDTRGYRVCRTCIRDHQRAARRQEATS